MKPYELSIICNSLHLRTKDSWEQARMISYITAQINSSKKLKPTDIIKFEWEQDKEDIKQSQSKQLTLSDVQRIKENAIKREKELKEKGII